MTENDINDMLQGVSPLGVHILEGLYNLTYGEEGNDDVKWVTIDELNAYAGRNRPFGSEVMWMIRRLIDFGLIVKREEPNETRPYLRPRHFYLIPDSKAVIFLKWYNLMKAGYFSASDFCRDHHKRIKRVGDGKLDIQD